MALAGHAPSLGTLDSAFVSESHGDGKHIAIHANSMFLKVRGGSPMKCPDHGLVVDFSRNPWEQPDLDKMKTVKCRCGAESKPVSGGSVGDMIDQSGFTMLWNVANGLECLWLCRECALKVRAAWLAIVEVTGTEKINMTGFLKKFKER